MWKAGGGPVLITRDGKHWPVALRDGVPVFRAPVPCAPAGVNPSQGDTLGDEVPVTPEVTTYRRTDKGATHFRTFRNQTPLGQTDRRWASIFRRLTTDLHTGEVIDDDREVQFRSPAELYRPIPGGPRDIETVMWGAGPPPCNPRGRQYP